MEARWRTTKARLDHGAGGIAMTTRWLRIVLLLGLMVIAARRESLACSCARTNPCQAAGHADSVFSGTVSSIEMVPANESSTQLFIVRINVEQAFVNAPRPVASLTMDISSCTFSFELGQRYLVYANNRSGKLTTSSCSRTRRFEITNVPADKTTLSVFFPFGFRPQSFEQEVDLSDAKACRQFDFSIRRNRV
jgi:hypothetical protein